MDVFNKTLCKENIKIKSEYITKNYKTNIEQILKLKIGGICSKHGYIKNDSIEIYKIALGECERALSSGNVEFPVYFYADVCNPAIGSFVTAVIANINRFGILAESGYILNNKYITVLEIIIPKNSININSDVDIELLKIGDKLTVEIVGKKFELNETRMGSIGRVIKDINNNLKKKTIEEKEKDEEEDEEKEEAYDVDDSDEDDSDEEKEDGSDSDADEETKGGSEFYSDEENFFSDEEKADEADEADDADDNDDENDKSSIESDNNDDD